MSMGTSRDKRCVGLIPGHWVVAFEKEDPVGDPAFQYHEVAFSIEVDVGINAATNPTPSNGSGNVYWIIQTSDDGVTWITVSSSGNTPVVPGGHRAISAVHQHRWVRCCLFSHSTGRVDMEIHHWEDQVLPNFNDGVYASHPLTCSTWCEVDCETGAESTDEETQDR